ncbi:MAG: NADH-quinone oxidoreductase subunit J [Deltaproteobacteria bacterium]|nr:NADH-quinone oxidoreductase subunit J [Deltaproteobacteria bacterium]
MDPSVLALYACCLLALAGGAGVIVLRNPVHAAISLLFTMLALGGAYAMMQAHLLAALQVLIYAGAIVILIVYVIMLLDQGREEVPHPFYPLGVAIGVPLAVLLVVISAPAFMGASAGPEPLITGPEDCTNCESAAVMVKKPDGSLVEASGCEDYVDTDNDGFTDCNDPDCHDNQLCYGTVRAVGGSLLGPFVLPFEVASVLLLAGIAGSILLTGRRPKELEDVIAGPAIAPAPGPQVVSGEGRGQA